MNTVNLQNSLTMLVGVANQELEAVKASGNFTKLRQLLAQMNQKKYAIRSIAECNRQGQNAN